MTMTMSTGPALLGAVTMALLLSACANQEEAAAPPLAAPPLYVGNGSGSQYGNYAPQVAGEMRGPSGERCVVFNWDRPVSASLAVRLTSASCESAERPGRMVAREISRTVIPIAESTLKDAGRTASN
jgi:hypothetical protein